MGILIDPNKYMLIGNFRHGERHGKYYHFYSGLKIEGECKKDQPVGLEVTTYSDGKPQKVRNYASML